MRDLSSHFLDLSGFRSTTNDFPGPFGIEYIQCYTIDKAATYHPDDHGHSLKYITTDLAMKGDPPGFVQSLHDVYINAGNTSDCAARFEVCFPIQSVTGVAWTSKRDSGSFNHTVQAKTVVSEDWARSKAFN